MRLENAWLVGMDFKLQEEILCVPQAFHRQKIMQTGYAHFPLSLCSFQDGVWILGALLQNQKMLGPTVFFSLAWHFPKFQSSAWQMVRSLPNHFFYPTAICVTLLKAVHLSTSQMDLVLLAEGLPMIAFGFIRRVLACATAPSTVSPPCLGASLPGIHICLHNLPKGPLRLWLSPMEVSWAILALWTWWPCGAVTGLSIWPALQTLGFLLCLLQIDHFGFLENRTFQQRYLIAEQHWKRDVGSILFYTGNEGDITWFANNTVGRALVFHSSPHLLLGVFCWKPRFGH